MTSQVLPLECAVLQVPERPPPLLRFSHVKKYGTLVLDELCRLDGRYDFRHRLQCS